MVDYSNYLEDLLIRTSVSLAASSWKPGLHAKCPSFNKITTTCVKHGTQ